MVVPTLAGTGRGPYEKTILRVLSEVLKKLTLPVKNAAPEAGETFYLLVYCKEPGRGKEASIARSAWYLSEVNALESWQPLLPALQRVRTDRVLAVAGVYCDE